MSEVPARRQPPGAAGPARPSSSAVLRELGLVCAVLLVALVVTTGIALLLTPFEIEKPGKVARKLLVPLFIVLYVVSTRIRLRSLPRVATLWPPPPRPVSRVSVGFAAGALALLFLLMLQFLPGWRELELERSAPELCLRAVYYLVATIVFLGVLEESLFRGVLHHRLERAGGTATALLLGSALFSAAHFLRPVGKGKTGLDGVWEVIPGCLEGLGRMGERWPEVVGLFLVGLVLAIIRWRTGHIYVCIGVHGGWAWIRAMNSGVTDQVDSAVGENLLLIGTNKFYNGILGWVALALTLLIVMLVTKKRGDSS